MNIKTFIAWAILTALMGCATTPPEEAFRPEGLPPTAAGIPGGVQLFWNASPSTNVGGYKVSYGQTSGNYTLTKDAGNVTSTSITGLTEGAKYYFAVKAYDTTRTAESGYSNEISYTMPVTPVTPPPTADFTANPTSGYASLAVNFTPVTTGTVTSWKWDFPGSYTPSVTNTTAKVTTATYATPGTYNATLTVTGPGGTATKTAPNLISVAAAPVTPPPTTPPPTTPPTTPPPSGIAESSKLGLVAAYAFEEPAGSTVADASGKGNHGTIREATRVNTGRSGKALSFDGVNDWITVNDSASLDLTTGLTLEAWVYPTATMSNWAVLLMKERTSGNAYCLIANTDRNQPALDPWIGGDQFLAGGTQLSPNKWWHVVGTYDGQKMVLYVNGAKVAERAQTGSIVTSTGVLRIGGDNIWDEFFKGYIDEIRIYNRALTAEEVSYNNANAISTTNPPQFLMGDKTVEPTWDDIPQGLALAYRTTPEKSGIITTVSVYIPDGSTATELIAGIYTDNNGHPGTLVGQGKLSTFKPDAWNSVPISTVNVTAGTRYWIALLGSKGVIAYRDREGSGTGILETSASRTLTTLPSTWSRGSYFPNADLSVVGLGY